MSTKEPKPTPLEILDEISHHDAQGAVASRESGDAERQWSRLPSVECPT